jgi:hypothetical protein
MVRAIVALGVAVALVSCTKKASAPELSGSIYASQIPVYPAVKLVDTGGGNYYEELGGAPTFESKSWFFETKDSVTMLTAFYENHLPSGSRQDDAEEGTVLFKFTPKGAEEGEDVSIHIEPGKLNISEVVKPGKRKS